MVNLCDHVDSLLLVGVSLEVHVAALVGETGVILLFLLLNVRCENAPPDHLPKVKLAVLLGLRAKELDYACISLHGLNATDSVG